MVDLNDFKQSTADWRHNLKRNKRRTRYVIISYFIIYTALGLFIDFAMLSSVYPNAPAAVILKALVTFDATPWVTLVMLVVAAISLWVTYLMYDKLMLLGTEYHEVVPGHFKNLEEQTLFNVVEEMKVAAGLRYMPKVFIIEANYMNAFASGYSEKSAMVAITRGLMVKLNREELKAVMAHELSHIRHLDIKLTLMASVLSNIILMVVDMLYFSAIIGGGRRSSQKGGNVLVLVVVALRILLPIITVLLMLYLSRTREYMADAGCVELMRDNEPLATALIKISQDHEAHTQAYQQEYGQTAHETVRHASYIYNPAKAGFSGFSSLSDMLSTHPTLKKRLAAIGFTKHS